MRRPGGLFGNCFFFFHRGTSGFFRLDGPVAVKTKVRNGINLKIFRFVPRFSTPTLTLVVLTAISFHIENKSALAYSNFIWETV